MTEKSVKVGCEKNSTQHRIKRFGVGLNRG